MKKFSIVLLILVLAGSVLFAEGQKETGAAAWPTGTVQIVVPAKAGGSTDVMARIFTEYLQKEIGKPVVVVNQPSGGGTVGFEQVRNAKPDGLTLLFNHTGMIINSVSGKYDHPMSDFTNIAIAQSYPPQVYAVAADAPWNTMKEFVEDAKKNPGKYTVGISMGGTTHYIAGLLMQNEGIDLKFVEASSEVDKIAAIEGGHLTLGNLGVASAAQFETAGKLKVLCLIDEEPSKQFPQFVPAKDQGVDVSWLAPLVLWGPKGMDPAVVEKINAATKNMATDPKVADQLDKMASSFKYYNVDQVNTIVNGEVTKIQKLVKALGLN